MLTSTSSESFFSGGCDAAGAGTGGSWTESSALTEMMPRLDGWLVVSFADMSERPSMGGGAPVISLFSGAPGCGGVGLSLDWRGEDEE